MKTSTASKFNSRGTVLPASPWGERFTLMAEASKYLENPLPHLQEARKSALRIFYLQKELLGIRAEITAAHQIKKMGLALGVIISVMMALLFTFAWMTIALHEAGWRAGAIALISLFFFILIAGVFAYFFKRPFELNKDHEP